MNKNTLEYHRARIAALRKLVADKARTAARLRRTHGAGAAQVLYYVEAGAKACRRRIVTHQNKIAALNR